MSERIDNYSVYAALCADCVLFITAMVYRSDYKPQVVQKVESSHELFQILI